MTEIKNEIEAAYPGIFVHAIRIGATDNADRLASFYDSLNRQVIRSTHSVLIVKVDEICQQLSSIEELKDGFDAVGFSQGGQILRAYVQRCNIPRVRNLITIGAQHQGVMDLPGCQSDAPVSDEGDSDFALVQVLMPDILAKDGDCGWWQRMVKKNIYSDLVQGRIVQAQYFKDPHRFEEYLQKNSFLTDINNERGEKNGTYAENIGKLENFVMFMFTKDQQVVPKESAWFGYFDGKKKVTLQEQDIYKEDWIGLKTLDGRGALHFNEIEDDHVNALGYPPDCIIAYYFGKSYYGMHSDPTAAKDYMLRKELPTAKIISVRVGQTTEADSYNSYFDNANRQVHEVCDNLRRDPLLKNGFNAIGLSQGGLMMRALVEKCSGLKVNRLITFGSPLQGVAAYPGCGGPSGWAKFSPWRIARAMFRKVREKLLPCSVLQRLVGPSVYTRSAQNSVMPAQYYKDPRKIPQYLASNDFLVDINNERAEKNAEYKRNFMKLNKLVIYHFDEEEIVYPQESTNFGYFENGKIVSMRELPIYKEDWIGLKELDKRKAIIQIKLPGEHLNINESVVRSLVPYLQDNKQ